MDGAQILIAGIGGLGSSWAQRAHIRTGHDIDLVLIDADESSFNAPDAHVIRLGRDLDSAGCAALPPLGEQRMRQASDVSRTLLEGVELVILLTGLGGGTGTGAAPVVASIAKELGALTVAVVTKPFKFEGKPRMSSAEKGLAALVEEVDSLITIPNQKLIDVLGANTPIPEAFAQADDVLKGAVQGISDIIMKPGLINVDYADVKTVMSEKGIAMMGTGKSNTKDRGRDAAE